MLRELCVLIVDDQRRGRQSLRALLATVPGIGQLREAEGGKEALASIVQSGADVVVMDLKPWNLDVLEATRIIKRNRPQTRVVILTLYDELRQAALAAGADAFVATDGSSEGLLRAVLGGK